jgi:hypothetical protein
MTEEIVAYNAYERGSQSEARRPTCNYGAGSSDRERGRVDDLLDLAEFGSHIARHYQVGIAIAQNQQIDLSHRSCNPLTTSGEDGRRQDSRRSADPVPVRAIPPEAKLEARRA